MKKTAFFTSALALMILVLGTSTAEASTRYTYSPVVKNYNTTYRNCTERTSDLGLGGGVFVAGTTLCSTPVSTQYYSPVKSYKLRSAYDYSYNSNQNTNSKYYEEDSYNDTNERGHYEEDKDSKDDEDTNGNNNSNNNKNGGGKSGTIW